MRDPSRARREPFDERHPSLVNSSLWAAGAVAAGAGWWALHTPVTLPLLVPAVLLSGVFWLLCLYVVEHLRAGAATRQLAEQQQSRDRRPARMSVHAAINGPDGQLVGDEHRDVVIENLNKRFTQGYLTLGEFQARADEAIGARTHGQLSRCLRGLPQGDASAVPRFPTSR